MALNIDKKLQGIETREMNEYLLAEIDAIDTEDLTESIDMENVAFISSEKNQLFPSDSLAPPKKEVQTPQDPSKTTAENPEKEELLNNVADDSNLEDGFFCATTGCIHFCSTAQTSAQWCAASLNQYKQNDK